MRQRSEEVLQVSMRTAIQALFSHKTFCHFDHLQQFSPFMQRGTEAA